MTGRVLSGIVGLAKERVLRHLVGSICKFSVDVPVAALTFDDGPDPRFTPQVLDLLKEYSARATFFLLGERAAQYPELVEAIAHDGHAIGNHSWNHRSFPKMKAADRRNQIRNCEKVLGSVARRLFRPPYGDQSLGSRLDPFLLGYEVVGWSVDVGDWWQNDPDEVAVTLTQRVKPGCIILLHDSLYVADSEPNLPYPPVEDRGVMMQALRMFLEQSTGKYSFLTIPEMFDVGAPVKRNWFKNSE